MTSVHGLLLVFLSWTQIFDYWSECCLLSGEQDKIIDPKDWEWSVNIKVSGDGKYLFLEFKEENLLASLVTDLILLDQGNKEVSEASSSESGKSSLQVDQYWYWLDCS